MKDQGTKYQKPYLVHVKYIVVVVCLWSSANLHIYEGNFYEVFFRDPKSVINGILTPAL